VDYCRQYFTDAIKKYPDRFIGTVGIDYDLRKNEQHREAELKKLCDSVRRDGMKGLVDNYPRGQQIDDERFEPLWEELSRLRIPFITNISAAPRQVYLDRVDRIEKVMKKFSDVNWVINHLGGNVRPPSDPEYLDIPEVLLKILRLPNAYFEAGYVLSYAKWSSWKEDYEYPYLLHAKLVKKVYDEVGAERLLWGSDMPNNLRTCTYLQSLDLVRLHFDFLSEEEKNLVLDKNPARLFGI